MASHRQNRTNRLLPQRRTLLHLVSRVLPTVSLSIAMVSVPAQAADALDVDRAGQLARETLDEVRGRLADAPPQVETGREAGASGEGGVDDYVDVDADNLEVDRKNRIVRAQGNVRIVQTGVMELRADRAEYHYNPKQVQAVGNIRLTRGGDLFTSERIQIDLSEHQGRMEAVRVDMDGPGGRGAAESVVVHDRNRLTMNKASFTNCECDDPAWKLTAEEIRIDRAENSVTGDNVRLHLGSVPVAVLPWWRHPLVAKSKSGFLVPSAKVTGNGLEVEVPYYWTIAPNRDATLALRSVSERGMMGKLQYRYLGQDHQGQLDTQYIYDTAQEAYRGLTVLNHRHELDAWRMGLHVEATRSRDYVNDFEQELVDPRHRRLESALELNRLWLRDRGYSNVQTGVRWYQDLEAVNDDLTVQSLPFALVSDSRSLGSLPLPGSIDAPNWRVDTELRLDNFYQMAGDAAQRIDIAPVAHYQRPLYFGRMEAVFGLRETAYLLQGDPGQTGQARDSSYHREASLFGLRLDGQLQRIYGNGTKHILTPSVQYVNNAATDQSKLPDYDTTLRNFTTTNLFTHNLYTGVDRISTGHWVSYGLTSRLLRHGVDNAIFEDAVFSIGQRWAPSGHREYQEDEAFSDIAARMSVALSRNFKTEATARYSPDHGELDTTDISATLTTAKRNWLTLGYHFNRPGATTGLLEDGSERIENILLDSSYQLSDNWYWTQMADYSVELDDVKSWETGLAYEHQCWTLRLTGGRRLATETNRNGGGYLGVYFELLGLGGYGV